MKVILLQDVKSLGKKGETVTVNDGYARNFILPKKLGVEATSKNLNDLKLQKQHQDKLAAQQLADAKELAKRLEGITVELKVKTGEGGKVFGSVSTKEIAAAVKKQHNLELDKKKMQLDVPIKNCGVHNVSCRLHKDVTGILKVHVSEA
ncbi:LSU ribosomal protein L9p [Lachnospiraceae bacterium TWA4]|nr:LSU ribosomal protein L9p [Lachnospiraceae bacterium TWA4]